MDPNPELTFDGGCQLSAAVSPSEPAAESELAEKPYRAAVRRAIMRYGWTLAGGEEGVDEIVDAILAIPHPETEELRAELNRLADRTGTIPVRVFRVTEAPHTLRWTGDPLYYRYREGVWETLDMDKNEWLLSRFISQAQMTTAGYLFEEVTGNGE